MRAEFNVPDRLGAFALDAALEGLTQLAAAELAEDWSGVQGAATIPQLYESGVRYERENGSERWLTPSQVMELGVGDCEDLSAWRAAELRVSGEDPAAVARVVRSGPRTWHAVVQRGDGTVEDPSRALGMGEREVGSLADWRLMCEPMPGGGWMCRIGRGDSYIQGVAPLAPDALMHAADLATVAGELGVFPGLDVIARAAQGALQAVLPGATPQRSSPPARAAVAPRAVTRPVAPAVPPATMPASVDEDVERIARQIDGLTRREVSRKVAKVERDITRAARRAGRAS